MCALSGLSDPHRPGACRRSLRESGRRDARARSIGDSAPSSPREGQIEPRSKKVTPSQACLPSYDTRSHSRGNHRCHDGSGTLRCGRVRGAGKPRRPVSRVVAMSDDAIRQRWIEAARVLGEDSGAKVPCPSSVARIWSRQLKVSILQPAGTSQPVLESLQASSSRQKLPIQPRALPKG